MTYFIRSLVVSLFSVFLLTPVLLAKQNGSGLLFVDKHTVPGIQFLEALPGLWSGPVTTDTPAGSFPMWYVDFRPVAPGQISQYSTLDDRTHNHLSFFLVQIEGEVRIAQRTYGVFMDQGCVTYEVLIEADPERGYYKFADFVAGDKRAYTEYFVQEDSLTMRVYTTKFNKQKQLTLHSEWKAVRADTRAAEWAVMDLYFPQGAPVKDFTGVFNNKEESIYYTFKHDPYPTRPQPYVGKVKVKIDWEEHLERGQEHEILLLLTTQPLYKDSVYLPENLKYTSRSVYLKPDTTVYTFEFIHPGSYYLYAFVDTDGDRRYTGGDYMSSIKATRVKVYPEKMGKVSVKVEFKIP